MTIVEFRVDGVIYDTYPKALQAANGNKNLITTIYTSYNEDGGFIGITEKNPLK